MALEFEWDPGTAVSNFWKHGADCQEAATVFQDPRSMTITDLDHSLGEERLVIFGVSARGRVLAVMDSERSSRIRIISAREATRRERDAHAEGIL